MSEDSQRVTPQQAWDTLIAGNERCVTGGSARARHPLRSQRRQAGPTGVVATCPGLPGIPGSAAP